eukprot:CAMPEP_0202962550 /NCGR_PEP_ID=MMETSP1396-20130829/6660_1 /ASSEMBLY_ACC=CAM_ASM_000872 /TAXON_ID= /ORGANISM="Pseudokeronopsis sp., Strain Brazil" /LENGTH=70 /DNA_ID=CAMNT_0049683225 /DNA_START=367 /DNA_END=579 /DNA_ORIENTATION=-
MLKEKELRSQAQKQDFEDIASGKKAREAEKSVAQVFKEYFDKAKNIDHAHYTNQAKASINSFSSYLEKKR